MHLIASSPELNHDTKIIYWAVIVLLIVILMAVFTVTAITITHFNQVTNYYAPPAAASFYQ